MGLLSRLLGGVSVVVAAIAFFQIKQAKAVKAARDGYVSQVLLIEAQAELAETRRRLQVAELSEQNLVEKLQVMHGERRAFSAQLRAFENETKINPDGRVDGELFERLRRLQRPADRSATSSKADRGAQVQRGAPQIPQ